MNRLRMINGVLCKRVTLLDSGCGTLKEVKEAIEAAEKLISPSIEVNTSYEESAVLTIEGYEPASENEVLNYKLDQERLARQQESDLRKRFEELKARFEPSLKASR